MDLNGVFLAVAIGDGQNLNFLVSLGIVVVAAHGTDVRSVGTIYVRGCGRSSSITVCQISKVGHGPATVEQVLLQGSRSADQIQLCFLVVGGAAVGLLLLKGDGPHALVGLVVVVANA